MARQRIAEEPVNHERWLVSYADFITLLFAFFVVMYSISQVNDGKYKVLSQTLTDAFSNPELINPERRLDPFQIGEIAKSNPRNFVELDASAIVERDSENTGEGASEGEGTGNTENDGALPTEFEQINSRIDEEFSDLIKQKMITVRGNEEWLEIELSSSLLFSSGDAQLSTSALEVLEKIVSILKDGSNPIRVEGFTDNVPINTQQFPSNWELSAARATAVVQLFVEEGITPSRLAAIGYGEHQPVDSNETPEGRNRNRRIVLMISKDNTLRPSIDAEKAPATSAVQEPATTSAPEQQFETIQLEGGGLLFTNDPTRANLKR